MKLLPDLIAAGASYQSGRFNRAAAETDAVNIERDGAYNEGLMRDRARVQIGKQVAAQADSGFAMGTGSALDALRQSEEQATLDILAWRRDNSIKAMMTRARGKLAWAEGRAQANGSLFTAASKAIDYAAQAAGG